MTTKACDHCGSPMKRKPTESAPTWRRRRYCCHDCRVEADRTAGVIFCAVHPRRRAEVGTRRATAAPEPLCKICLNARSRRAVADGAPDAYLVELPPWTHDGPTPCMEADPAMWEPTVTGGKPAPEEIQAARLCRGCPALMDCYDRALAAPPIGLIQAGLYWDGHGRPRDRYRLGVPA